MAYRRQRRLRPSIARPRPSPPSIISFRFLSVEKLLTLFLLRSQSLLPLILRRGCESPVKSLRRWFGYFGRPDSDRQLSLDAYTLQSRVWSRRRWDPETIWPPAPTRLAADQGRSAAMRNASALERPDSIRYVTPPCSQISVLEAMRNCTG